MDIDNYKRAEELTPEDFVPKMFKYLGYKKEVSYQEGAII